MKIKNKLAQRIIKESILSFVFLIFLFILSFLVLVIAQKSMKISILISLFYLLLFFILYEKFLPELEKKLSLE